VPLVSTPHVFEVALHGTAGLVRIVLHQSVKNVFVVGVTLLPNPGQQDGELPAGLSQDAEALGYPSQKGVSGGFDDHLMKSQVRLQKSGGTVDILFSVLGASSQLFEVVRAYTPGRYPRNTGLNDHPRLEQRIQVVRLEAHKEVKRGQQRLRTEG